MKSAVSLLFLFLSATAAFSLRFLPVSAKRFVLSAKTITTPLSVTSDDVPEASIVLKRNDYLSSLPSNAILGDSGTPLCNLYLDLINEPERYLATIRRNVSHGIHKKNVWSIVTRYIGSVLRRLRLGGDNKSPSKPVKNCA